MEPAIFGLVVVAAAVVALIITKHYEGIITKRDEEIRLLTLKVSARDVNIEYVYKCNRALEKENKLLLEIRTVALNKQLWDEKHKLKVDLDASKQTIERLQAVITKADGC